MGEKDSVFYIGADDSNHAGTNVKGEVILVTFSQDMDNIELRKNPNRRTLSPQDWIDEGNDYRFAILTDTGFKKRNYNLVLAVPLVMREYFKQNPQLNPETLICALDGNVEKYQEEFFKRKIAGLCRSSYVKGFVKKGLGAKRNPTPRAVYAADNLASYYFSNKLCLGRVLNDERMVSLQLEELLEMDEELRKMKPRK